VKEGDIIILDSGSTTMLIAEELVKLKHITVITNSLTSAFILSDNSDIMLLICGGTPLNDEDRMPWLNLISNAAFAMSNVNNISIIICSALKRQYRDIIRGENENVHFIYLKGSFDVIAQRLAKRQGHYQKTGMLQSQFDALEEPSADEKDVYAINIEQSLNDVIHDATKVINSICHCE